jgi:hypothetical protein
MNQFGIPYALGELRKSGRRTGSLCSTLQRERLAKVPVLYRLAGWSIPSRPAIQQFVQFSLPFISPHKQEV